MRIVFDIETNGLLDELTRVHCIAAINVDTGEEKLFVNDMYRADSDGIIEEGLDYLSSASLLIGHNIQGFDIPALGIVYGWSPTPDCKIYDTQIVYSLAHSDIKDEDFRNQANRRRLGKPLMPNKMIGKVTLAACGWRLGVYKDDYGDDRTDWSVYDAAMGRYCLQDTRVNVALFNHLDSLGLSELSVWIEHEFTKILRMQEKAGFRFDIDAAKKLEGELFTERAKLEAELHELFPPRTIVTFTPKKKLRREKEVPFNPNSRQQVAWNLTEKYGWKPTEFSASGQPKIDETVLNGLEYPEAKKLARVFMLTKRIGQLSEGRNAWLKLVKDDKRMHGWQKSIGTPHGRSAHYGPNMAQVPGAQSPYGKECRALFCARPGWQIVGADLSGIQLRALAHFMARWDDGEYIDVVCNQDPHEVNRQAAGLEKRSQAKTMIYAFLFGAGDGKLGTIVGGGKAAGKALKARLFKNLPALASLKNAVEKAAGARGWIKGLDGRRVPIRSKHVALNYLLASAEAVVMKYATILLHQKAEEAGYRWGEDYVQVAHVHDEVQLEARENIAHDIGRLAVQSMRDAGDKLGFRCPLDGEFAVGDNWSETH